MSVHSLLLCACIIELSSFCEWLLILLENKGPQNMVVTLGKSLLMLNPLFLFVHFIRNRKIDTFLEVYNLLK